MGPVEGRRGGRFFTVYLSILLLYKLVDLPPVCAFSVFLLLFFDTVLYESIFSSGNKIYVCYLLQKLSCFFFLIRAHARHLFLNIAIVFQD